MGSLLKSVEFWNPGASKSRTFKPSVALGDLIQKDMWDRNLADLDAWKASLNEEVSAGSTPISLTAKSWKPSLWAEGSIFKEWWNVTANAHFEFDAFMYSSSLSRYFLPRNMLLDRILSFDQDLSSAHGACQHPSQLKMS